MKLTVLIAAYNQAEFIDETLISVLESVKYAKSKEIDFVAQILVIDDGSTDNTKEVCQKYFPQVQYFYQKNQGQSAAYQNFLNSINGDYILLLDSDDLFKKEKINELLEFIKKTDGNPEFIMHPVCTIDSNSTDLGIVKPEFSKLSGGNITERVKKTGRVSNSPTSGLIFSKDLFINIHPNPLYGLPSASDTYFGLAASLKTEVFVLNKPLASYRQHSGSNYYKRLSTVNGLIRTTDIQNRVINHLGLENSLENNSYFARHYFVLSKMLNDRKKMFVNLLRLNRSIFNDDYLSTKSKIVFLIFWNSISLLPKKQFWRSWLFFLEKHTKNTESQ